MSEHERIVGFRNVLVHGYDLVDDGIVWDTIRTKLPPCSRRSSACWRSEIEILKREKQTADGEAAATKKAQSIRHLLPDTCYL